LPALIRLFAEIAFCFEWGMGFPYGFLFRQGGKKPAVIDFSVPSVVF
jgi:hypothetical protein